MVNFQSAFVIFLAAFSLFGQGNDKHAVAPLFGGSHLNLWDMTHWARSFDVATDLGISGLRVDLILEQYAPDPGRYDRKRLKQILDWAKRKGKKLRIILAYGPGVSQSWRNLGGNWDDYTISWKKCRPPREAWQAMADAFNDAISVASSTWGSGASEAVAWEFWNEPYGQGADDSFDRMAEAIVPKLRMLGMRLSGPTLHGHDIMGQISRVQGKPYWKLFDELAVNIYPEPQTDFARAALRGIERARMVIGAIRRTDSREVHIAETGLSAHSSKGPRNASFHEDRGTALGLMIEGMRSLGYSSVGLYSFANADSHMDDDKQFGIVDSKGRPYFSPTLITRGRG